MTTAVEREAFWASKGWPLKAREDEMTTATQSTGLQEPPKQQEEAAPVMAEANIFALNPAGFKVHIKLPSKAGSIVKNLDVLLGDLAAKGYKPDESMGGRGHSAPVAAQQPPQSAAPAVWVVNPDGTKSCSVHGPAAFQAPGVSQKTGKPYSGFWKCTDRGCRPIGGN